MALIKRQEKSVGAGVWYPLTYFGRGYVDYFQSEREPTKPELILAYEDTVFSCVRIVSENIGVTPLRLLVQTDEGQRMPKCKTKALGKKEKVKLYNSTVRRKAIDAQDISQVTNHPLLDLLAHPNQYDNYYDLLVKTDCYIEVTGNAYWQIINNNLGLPQELYLLPAHWVTPVPDASGFIQFYQYGIGIDKKILKPEEVVHFKCPDLRNPYIDGMPPVRAIWERQSLAKKEMSYLGASLSNQARFDGVLSPDQPLGYYESERLSKEITQRFRGAGSGGIFVTPEKFTFYPVQWSPRDLAELELYNVIKVSICNAFGVPPTLLESGANRAEKESDQYYLARYCLVPRLIRIAAKLTERLASQYDDRLWLEFDDPVPESKEAVLQERSADLAEITALLQQGVITRQEARDRYGFAYEEWADSPLVLGNMVDPTQEEEDIDLSSLMPSTPKPTAQDIINLQREVFSGAIPRAAAIQTALTIWGMSPQEAEALFPEPPEKEEPTTPVEADSPGEAEDASNTLRATVGGSAQVMALQQAYYAGQLHRDACIGNLMVLFGFTRAEAELLLPEKSPEPPGGPTAQPGEEPAPDEVASPGPKGGLSVPDVRQESDHDCGAACVRTVCQFFKVGPEQESDYIAALGTTHENGTSAESICRYLTGLGLTAEREDGLTVDALDELTRAGKPVICAVQGGSHWVVACGVDGQTVTVQDPIKGRTQEQDLKTGECIAVSKQEGKCLHCEPVIKANSVSKKIGKVLKKYFRVQRQQVLSRMKSVTDLTGFQGKALGQQDYGKEWYEWKGERKSVWNVSVDLSNWSEPMAKELLPLVAMSAKEGVVKTVERLGNPEGLAPVVEPKLKEALADSVMAFCEETNKTTSLQLEAAVTQLKEELGEGVSAGEQRNELAKRVQKVFDHADRDRALRIAVTEESRARHAGADMTAKESGLVKGWKWLLSSMPCKVCEEIASSNPEVELGEPFHSYDSGGPYDEVHYPPAHPNCQCSVTEVLND